MEIQISYILQGLVVQTSSLRRIISLIWISQCSILPYQWKISSQRRK